MIEVEESFIPLLRSHKVFHFVGKGAVVSGPDSLRSCVILLSEVQQGCVWVPKVFTSLLILNSVLPCPISVFVTGVCVCVCLYVCVETSCVPNLNYIVIEIHLPSLFSLHYFPPVLLCTVLSLLVFGLYRTMIHFTLTVREQLSETDDVGHKIFLYRHVKCYS